MSGFILGVIVGAVGIFLLGTKRGKKLLKILSEEGIEGMAELEELLTEKALHVEPTPIKKKVIKTQPKVEKKEPEIEVKESIAQTAEIVQEKNAYIPRALGRIQTSGKRFFKGIPKRTS